MLSVIELWRHPVKSMQGHCVDTLEIDQRGVVGDRRWAVRDAETGNVLTGRREPLLLHATGGDGFVTLPTGVVTSDGVELSTWLNRKVEFVGTTEGERSTYEVPLDPLEGETNWASWQGPSGSFVDSTRTAISLISVGAMRDWDHRRFRMNVVFDTDGDTDLVGKRIRLGSVILEVVKHVDRCVMVTRQQPDLSRDLDVLKAINQDHAGNLGIGALIIEPGIISLGDTVHILSSN
jgi:uncharacterized protein